MPKGYRLGTATEFLTKGQVRYYGLELIDLNTPKKNKNTTYIKG